MCITSKISLFSYLGTLPPPSTWPQVKVSQTKKVYPLGITYINIVYQNQTLTIQRKYEKCHLKAFTSPTPKIAPHENFAEKN